MDDNDDNVVHFPLQSTTVGQDDIKLDHDQYVNVRRMVYNCVEEVMSDIETNEDIIGVVCLTFDKSNTMYDKVAGEINAPTLYVMLDKVKSDLMEIICQELGMKKEEE